MEYEINESLARKVLGVVDAGLVGGMGNAVPGQMCVEAAVCFALGLPHSDEPPCVGTAVRRFKIRLNDSRWSSNEARTAGMRKLAVAQLGSNTIDQTRFVKLLAEQCIRKIVPIALRAVASMKGATKFADGLESAAVKCENEGTASASREAKALAREVRDAAAYDAAAAAAYAAADVADAARDRVLNAMAEIGVAVLRECGSPGCEYLWLCDN